MKILYVTTKSGTMNFFTETIKRLVSEGNTVELACNTEKSSINPVYYELGLKIHSINCVRSPLSKNNLKTIKQIRKIVSEGQFDIVHCHTPVAALCTRLACRKLRKKKGIKVVYTAHGFHFYKGAPKKNWLVYYPIEKLCAKMTDVIITINREDYEFAKKKLKAGMIEYVPGVGVNISKYRDVKVDRDKKRNELGVPNDAFEILSVGELNENKNQKTVVEAISKLDYKDNVYYVIAGGGPKKSELEEYAKSLGVNLVLLGHIRNVEEVYKTADLFALPSFREGLPVSVMEAMCSNIPVIASKIRGVVDLVNGENGALCDPFDASSFAKAIEHYYDTRERPVSKELLDRLSSDSVTSEIKRIYSYLQG